MSIVRRMLPCPSYDIAGLETWFRDCAAEGLFLRENGIGALSAQFETGGPKTMTYRFEPSAYILNTDAILDQDNLENKTGFLKEAGWQLLGSHRQYLLFAHAGTCELHTDPETESVIRMDLARARFVQLLRACVPLLFYGFLVSSHFMQLMIQTGSWIVLATIPFAVVSVIGSVTECVRLFIEASKLEKGIPYSHEKDWRKHAAAFKVFRIMKFCMYTLMAAAFVSMLAADASDAGRISLKDYFEDPPFMTVADFDPDAEYVMNSFVVESLREQFPTFNTMRHYSDLLSRDNYIWTEDAYLKKDESVYCFMNLYYYDTDYDFVTRRLFREYSTAGDPAFTQKFGGYDELSGSEDEHGLISFAFRKGKKVAAGILHADRGGDSVSAEVLQKLIDSVKP